MTEAGLREATKSRPALDRLHTRCRVQRVLIAGSVIADRRFQPGGQVVPGRPLPLVVLSEEVMAKVVAIVPPDRVDVVAVVDRVVELDQQVAALDSVVVRGAAVEAARPAEPEVAQTLALDPFELLESQLV